MNIEKLVARLQMLWPVAIPFGQYEPAIRLILNEGLDSTVTQAIRRHSRAAAPAAQEPAEVPVHRGHRGEYVDRSIQALKDNGGVLSYEALSRALGLPKPTAIGVNGVQDKLYLSALWPGMVKRNHIAIKTDAAGARYFYLPGYQAGQVVNGVDQRPARQSTGPVRFNRSRNSTALIKAALEEADRPLSLSGLVRLTHLRPTQAKGALHRLRKERGLDIRMVSFSRARGGSYVLVGSKAAKAIAPASGGANLPNLFPRGRGRSLSGSTLPNAIAKVLSELGPNLDGREIYDELQTRAVHATYGGVSAALSNLFKQGRLTRVGVSPTEIAKGKPRYKYSPAKEEAANAGQ